MLVQLWNKWKMCSQPIETRHVDEFCTCTNCGIVKLLMSVRLFTDNFACPIKKIFLLNFVCCKVLDYDVPLTVGNVREQIRKQFERNRHLNDIRAIDLLVVKVCIHFSCFSNSFYLYLKYFKGSNGIGRNSWDLEATFARNGPILARKTSITTKTQGFLEQILQTQIDFEWRISTQSTKRIHHLSLIQNFRGNEKSGLARNTNGSVFLISSMRLKGIKTVFNLFYHII